MKAYDCKEEFQKTVLPALHLLSGAMQAAKIGGVFLCDVSATEEGKVETQGLIFHQPELPGNSKAIEIAIRASQDGALADHLMSSIVFYDQHIKEVHVKQDQVEVDHG